MNIRLQNHLIMNLRRIFVIQGRPQKMQKLNEYPTTKFVNYECMRA